MQQFPYPISFHSFRFFPQVIFPSLDRSYALSSDLWILEVCQACDLPGTNQLCQANCLRRAELRHRASPFKSQRGRRTGAPPRAAPPSSQVGGRLSYVSLQASGARLRAPGRLLEGRAVSQQAPPREAGPARRARSSARESCRLQSPRPQRLSVRRRRSLR